MVVKFADTQKEKDQKRIHQVTTNLWGIGGVGLNSLTTPYLTVYLSLYIKMKKPYLNKFQLLHCRDYRATGVRAACNSWVASTPSGSNSS